LFDWKEFQIEIKAFGNNNKPGSISQQQIATKTDKKLSKPLVSFSKRNFILGKKFVSHQINAQIQLLSVTVIVCFNLLVDCTPQLCLQDASIKTGKH